MQGLVVRDEGFAGGAARPLRPLESLACIRNGGAAHHHIMRPEMIDERYSRIVIPSEVEESFSFAVPCLHK